MKNSVKKIRGIISTIGFGVAIASMFVFSEEIAMLVSSLSFIATMTYRVISLNIEETKYKQNLLINSNQKIQDLQQKMYEEALQKQLRMEFDKSNSVPMKNRKNSHTNKNVYDKRKDGLDR
ncbi:MAG: hypothetical protein AB7S44_04025 [Spirochaetales bacterium]